MSELSINLMRLRKLNKLSQQDVADAAGISRVAYRNLEKGIADPRAGTLQSLAKALNVSVFELLAESPRLQSLRYRANKKMSEQERAQGTQMLVRAANWLHDFNELETILNDQKPSLLKPARKGTKPETAAARLRIQLLGADCGCVPDICELLEGAGVKMLSCNFNMSELFGLSIGEPDGGPAMAINTGKNISIERQIFSIAHELGHLILHKDSYGKDSDELNDEQEIEADRFAAAFLMPRDQFIAEWNENRGLHWIDAVLKTKRHFKVSYQAVLRQLVEMGKAQSPAIYKRFRADYKIRYGKELHWKEEPPSDPVPQAPRLPPRAAGFQPANSVSQASGLPSAASDSSVFMPSRTADEPCNLDPLDLVEDRLGSLVRDALDRELITVSRAAEIMNLRIEEIRERMKSWEVVS